MRQIAGSFAQYEKTRLVTKLRNFAPLLAFPSVWCEQVFLDCKSGQNEGPASHDHPVMLPELITVVLTLPATAISPCPALES